MGFELQLGLALGLRFRLVRVRAKAKIRVTDSARASVRVEVTVHSHAGFTDQTLSSPCRTLLVSLCIRLNISARKCSLRPKWRMG